MLFRQLLACLLTVHMLAAQDKPLDLDYYLPQNVTYDKAIPTPKSIIGHEVGEWHVSHDKLAHYMTALAAASDRISIENRGWTYEKRPLYLLTITSPENHKNLEQIQQKHLAGIENDKLDVSKDPIVVLQGYSIHGNEPSGSNAALAVAYYLAAAQGPEIDKMLENTVILFDPSFNPDGLQRFAHWTNIHKSKHLISDPNDREYNEGWPKGRTNHYWFDMNRDWLPVQLPESRVRIETYQKWMPNLLTDHHEMGENTTYFFQPGIPTRTNPMTPKINQELTKEISTYHAKALDKFGSLYYSEENYDDYYYGKGSTYPDVNGAVGILFEQGSSRGNGQQTANGLLTFPFTVRNQFITSLSTLEAANSMRVKLLKYQQQFFKQSRRTYEDEAIVFGDAKDLAKTNHLAEVMLKHKIKIHKLKRDLTLRGKRFAKEASYAIPLNQRNHRLVQAMFDVRTKFQDSLFYDVSAWTFNHSFGVDMARDVSLSKLGKVVTELKHTKGSVSAQSQIGYLFDWHEYYTPKALNAILDKGIRAKVAFKRIKTKTKHYDYGAIFIHAQNQNLTPDALHAFLTKVAKESHIDIEGVTTGQNPGIDLGSRTLKTINRPRVALLVGEGTQMHDAGEVWHLLDQRFAMPLTKIDRRYAAKIDLSKYTTLVVTNGSAVDSTLEAKLKTWVKNGGVLIGYRKAVKWLAKKNFVNVKFLEYKENNISNVSFENKKTYHGAKVIGGSIFEAKIDRSHPINFGYKNNKIALFRNTTIFMKPDSKSYNNPIQYTRNPLLSGYIAKPQMKLIRNSVPFQAQSLGKGKVLVFTDNTNFRAFWYGTNKLMMNAIFFGDLM